MKKLAWLMLAGVVALAGCTTKKERVPGPLVVWISAEDEEMMELRLLSDDFTAQTKIPLELVIKTPYELQFALLRHPEDLAGVDVVEVDYFDLPEVSGQMQDLEKALQGIEGTERLFVEAFNEGRINGVQRFVPWRLSWPAMVSTSGYAHESSFANLAAQAASDQVTVLWPAMEDRDLYALLCAVCWSVQADPSDPGPTLNQAMKLIAALAEVIPLKSSATRPGGIAEMDDRGEIFFEWPNGILALGTDIPLDFESSPLPCNNADCVPFFGRYLAVPKNADHQEDAAKFVHFMISPHAQSRLAGVSSWLPVRSDAFGDLGGRARPYEGLTGGSTMLHPLPRDPKVQKALVAAGRKVLFEEASPEEGLREFNRLIK